METPCEKGRLQGLSIFLTRVADLGATKAKGIVLGEGEARLDIVIVEWQGARHAYVNQCPHQFIPLEIFPGHFFDADRKHLICSGHAALFEPDTGFCVLGPCNGQSLKALKIEERDGEIFWNEELSPEDMSRGLKSKRNW